MCKKFIERGVNFQYEAYSKENANNAFRMSCNICAQQGRYITCDRCDIAVAHSLVIAIFDDMERERDKRND